MRAGGDPKIPPPISIWLNWMKFIKGVNAALAWKLNCTKASSEMLIIGRVDTIKALVDECGISLGIKLVRSECNWADALTPVSQKWHGTSNRHEKSAVAVCGGAIESLSDDRIARIH